MAELLATEEPTPRPSLPAEVYLALSAMILLGAAIFVLGAGVGDRDRRSNVVPTLVPAVVAMVPTTGSPAPSAGTG